MPESEVISWRAPSERAKAVDRYARRYCNDNRAEAIDELVEIGLREGQAPILYRLRDHVVSWAGLLCVFAVAFLAGGIVTRYPAGRAYLMALTLVAIAVSMIGALELARAVVGQSAIGQQLREVRLRGE